MTPIALRVASRYLHADKAGSLGDLMKNWLFEAGDHIAMLTHGSAKQAFKQGHVVMVSFAHPEGGSESIGLRLNTYRGVLSLHHVLRDGTANEVDSMDLGQFGKFTPEGLAKWAIATVLGKAQLTMFRQ